MHQLVRRTTAVAAVLLLAGCSSPKPTPAPKPTPTPLGFRYTASELETALPATYGRHQLDLSAYVYPVAPNWTLRHDALAGHGVQPTQCRETLWNGRNTAPPGEFIPGETPSARASAELGARIGDDWSPNVRAEIVELTGELAGKYLHQFEPTPPECRSVQVDGVVRAGAVERALPGFGVESRYIARTFPLTGKSWTERILLYRAPTYVMTIRMDGFSVPDTAFLAFARQTRDHVTAGLKAG
ncbi:hypothetical protein GCM10009804_52450 [Kribbella hippodromi]|uniref:DUF5642 domain-containing protein n=1 Tax=Kribbella hippodromi TaxID=434347 RepID=A0ABP4PSU6_9ACTN